MRARDLLLTLDDAPEATLGQRIVKTLQRAILEGRLPPGTALPGSRILAEMLQVNRQTVIPALQELEAQGWLVTEPSRGTFVAEELPSGSRPALPAEPEAPRMGFDLPSFLKPVSVAATGALLFAWRYRATNKEAIYEPEWDHSIQLELVIWSAPLLIGAPVEQLDDRRHPLQRDRQQLGDVNQYSDGQCLQFSHDPLELS